MSSSSQQIDAVFITRAKVGGVTDSYIVMLKDKSEQPAHMRWVNKLQEKYRSSNVLCKVGFEYNIFKGYSAELNGAALEEISRSPDVNGIYQNQELADDAENEPAAHVVQQDTAWGLQRISQQAALPQGSDPDAVTYVYRFDQQAQPTPVDVYVIDSGVYVGHSDFGGRARWGAVFQGATEVDSVGHGTHVAGIVAGTRWGASKDANIIAVKNRKDNQPPTTDYAVKSFDWVVDQVNSQSPKRASIINYSGGGQNIVPLDNAAAQALAAGVHVCAAAGNAGVDVAETSPARVPGVVAVGGTNIDDSKRATSNFGDRLTIFAPGQQITSAFIGNPNATARKSGTSQAAPHVSGVMAYLMGKEGSMTPPVLRARIQALGVANALTAIGQGSPNLLLNNGILNPA